MAETIAGRPAPAADVMTRLRLNARLFWEGALLSYIALFRWLEPSMYLASKVFMPVTYILFFTFIGVYATGWENASFYVVGNAIQMTLSGVKKDRPLTHDLIGNVLLGLGAQLDHIVVNDQREGTFFARILLRMENELGKKIVELDARPSDSIVLALQQKRSIFVARSVFDGVEDMTEILERVLKQQSDEPDEDDEQT